MPKIDRNGRVSYEADAKASADSAVLEEKLAEDEAEIAELEAEQAAPAPVAPTVVIEHPADGTTSPPVSNAAPAAAAPRPPRVPPRRTSPPGGAGD
ncbi:MAG TPA: hypothetical protein VIL16_12485 [Trebonia sp.]